MSIIAYIGIGSNVGDKKTNCLKGIGLLSEGGRVVSVSSLYYTEPVGFKEQEDFINAVAAVDTDLPPMDLLSICLSIEDRLGRVRSLRWGPRTLDLDILLYGDLVMDQPDLVIPHPMLAARKFVLMPLAEIAPQATHPVLNKSASQLLQELRNTHTVIKCGPGNKTI